MSNDFNYCQVISRLSAGGIYSVCFCMIPVDTNGGTYKKNSTGFECSLVVNISEFSVGEVSVRFRSFDSTQCVC